MRDGGKGKIPLLEQNGISNPHGGAWWKASIFIVMISKTVEARTAIKICWCLIIEASRASYVMYSTTTSSLRSRTTKEAHLCPFTLRD